MKEQELNKDHILPVKMVSTDHYISQDPGRLYHTKGKSDPSDIYSRGCVLIDHASGYMRIKHHVYINTTETLKAKLTFDKKDKSQGVFINVYHTNNGIFNTSKFMEDLLKKNHNIRFSGSSISHQNGAAERAIKKWVTLASSILMQAWLICRKDTLSIDFGQRKWTIIYGSEVGSLLCSMVYKPLGKFEPYMFWSQNFKIIE